MLLRVSDELFVRNLGSVVVGFDAFVSLQAEVTVEALHVHDGVDTYGVGVCTC